MMPLRLLLAALLFLSLPVWAQPAPDDIDPALQAAEQHNFALSHEMIEAGEQAQRAAEQAEAAQRKGKAVADALRNTRTRLELGAEDESIGLILLSERRRLEDPTDLGSELEATRRRLARVQLRQIELDEERERMAAPEQAIDEALRRIDAEGEDSLAEAQRRSGLTRLFTARAQLLPRVQAAQRDLVEALVLLEGALQAQLDGTRELVRILDRQLLWIPSHEPIGSAWLQRQAEGWSDLFKPSRYATSARRFADAVLERWPFTLLAAALFVALLWLRRGIPARIDALSQPLTRVRTDRYRYTLRALFWTAVGALPWPLLVGSLGWLMRHAGEAGKFSDSLGASLIALAGGVALWQGLRWIGRERGLGHLHFRWTRARRVALRATLPWIGALLPLYWLLMLAFIRGQEPAIDAVARLLLLALCALAGWIAWKGLAPGALWTPRGRPNIEPVRLRQALRLGLVALLVALAGLALDGYVLTTAVMLNGLWLSVSALFAVGVVHGLIARWFLLGERRLALKRMELKREAELEDASDRSDAGGDAVPDAEPEEVTLESINAQTRRLLRALTIALLAVALLWVWSDVLPALARLEDVALWDYSDVDADGKTVAAAVTLRAFLVGLATLLLTFIAARNLPGLVELGLLSRTHLDAPTRYAITSVSRYVIVIGGTVAGLSLLGVRWSQLQWMAAALTVGLGFGLQEIFANFVSGLIVLFERPYRVGDIITIGEVEGTVTRIRTRATTVLDWDNKEVVVPNKTFITERFVNWTLTDSVTRVVLKIGVAYASSADEVRHTLLEIATSDEHVLQQPPPTCWLLALGASTMDFELRVFVGEILDRNRVRHALYQRIVAVFRERGIEIAFPQMDLWVRQTPGGGVEASSREQAGAPPAAG